MIIDKPPLPDDPTPADAPPSYDAISAPSPYPRDDKSTPVVYPPAPSAPPQHPKHRPPPSPSTSKSKSWFNFSSSFSRTNREVQTTIQGLVRDLVRFREFPSSPSAAKGILDSCQEACTAHGLSFSEILQEKSIEGHTPIYWAIVKRPPEHADDGNDENEEEGPDLVTALLQLSSPLTPATISEIRLACLVTSDQALFQRLRLSPAFSPIKGTDEMLLGENAVPPDTIDVQDIKGDEGAFVVELQISMFQKRMRISGGVEVEFIARARLWSLSFSIAPTPTSSCDNSPHRPGSWLITLALLEHSPPTWIDSRLVIDEPPPPSSPPSSTTSPPSPTSKLPRNPKPTITLRLKSGSSELIAPPPPELDSRPNWKKELDSKKQKVVVSLDQSLMGGSLQYAGSSYIGADGSLKARLEARLTKPEAECVIC